MRTMCEHDALITTVPRTQTIPEANSPMIDQQPTTVVSLTDAAAVQAPRADQGRDQPGHRPARLRLLRRLLRLPLRDDARGRPDARGPVLDASGIKVYVDGQSVDLLQGSQIDYVDTLMGAGFTVNNPNAVAACGCGSSFRTADDGGAPQGLRALTD